jgi:hypothetical protein
MRAYPWRNDRRSRFVTINGMRHNLGPDRALAHQEYHRLMTQPKSESVQHDSVLSVMDAYLDWTQRHRAPRTYTWCRDYRQSFADTLPAGIRVPQLKPWHVRAWSDNFPQWNGGHRRGAITAIQRAFRWAQKMCYIDRSQRSKTPMVAIRVRWARVQLTLTHIRFGTECGTVYGFSVLVNGSARRLRTVWPFGDSTNSS